MSENLNEDKIDLTELEEVAGGIGSASCGKKCPVCGSSNVTLKQLPFSPNYTIYKYTCEDCGHTWSEKHQVSSGSNPRPQEN